MQNMVYSTRLADENGVEGVVTYARTANDFDVLTWLDKDGNIISQSQQRILQALACHPETQAQQPLDNHHELVGKAVGIIREQAVSNIGGMLGNRFPHATASCSFWNNIMTKVKTCSSMQTAARN